VQVSLKKREIQAFWNGLQSMSQGEQHRRFAYGVARNIAKLRSVIETLVEATKPIEEYDERRIALAREMARKDEKGEPIQLPGNQGIVISDPALFNEKIKVLKEETGQDKRDKEVEELMESTEEIDVYMVDFDLIPEKIRSDLLEAIMPMIREPQDNVPESISPDAN
jgi:hypothetical protein